MRGSKKTIKQTDKNGNLDQFHPNNTQFAYDSMLLITNVQRCFDLTKINFLYVELYSNSPLANVNGSIAAIALILPKNIEQIS